MRDEWAQAWHRNLAPGGLLITMMFPLEPQGREGPPWPVSRVAYKNALEPLGFECFKDEQVSEEDATVHNRKGREAFALWRRAQGGKM